MYSLPDFAAWAPAAHGLGASKHHQAPGLFFNHPPRRKWSPFSWPSCNLQPFILPFLIFFPYSIIVSLSSPFWSHFGLFRVSFVRVARASLSLSLCLLSICLSYGTGLVLIRFFFLCFSVPVYCLVTMLGCWTSQIAPFSS